MNKKAAAKQARSRVQPIMDEIRGWTWNYVEQCNVCGSRERTIVARADRYGFPLRVALCVSCGLGYLVDRLSQSEYARFYAGAYRGLTSAWHNKSYTTPRLDESANWYGKALIRMLEREFVLPPQARMLDVGGSTGTVSQWFRDRFQVAPTVLDPSADELAAAKRLGMPTIAGQLETLSETDGQYDFILVSRTLDHLFCLRSALERIRCLIKPTGHIFVDYMDFLTHAKLEGSGEMAARLDHCYYFCNEFAEPLYSRFGFEIVSSYFSVSLGTCGYLLRPAIPACRPINRDLYLGIVRNLLDLATRWGATPAVLDSTLSDRLRDYPNRIWRRLVHKP